MVSKQDEFVSGGFSISKDTIFERLCRNPYRLFVPISFCRNSVFTLLTGNNRAYSATRLRSHNTEKGCATVRAYVF